MISKLKPSINTFRLILIVFIAAVSTVVVYPQPTIIPKTIFGKQINVNWGAETVKLQIGQTAIVRELKIRKGLDLQGGVQLVYDIDLSKIPTEDSADAISGVRTVMERRVNFFGVSEANVQTSLANGQNRLIIELPGVYDVEEALQVIGRTAKLDFRLLKPGVETPTSIEDYVSSGLSGALLKKAQVQFDSQTGEPVVGITFDGEGTTLFEKITSENIQKPLAIFLDDQLISAPIVQTAIMGGNAIISGSFTTESAKTLSIQLNGGALPAPVNLVQQRTIGASLGEKSVNTSIIAGIVGLLLVMIFMLAYYGWLGLVAVVSLLTYALITLALYILIPITLTLPGIAGFLLSIGMAVDSTILVFERLKEERRAGMPTKLAVEAAFDRAWNSIKDANINTLIICFILSNPLNLQFLNSSGMVKGFALTLALGIAIGLFTGLVMVRTLIRVFYVSSDVVFLPQLPKFNFSLPKIRRLYR